MNFQTSKRIMCCLLAALILCCAVVRPLEASATAILPAIPVLSGITATEAIGGILAALGIGAAFSYASGYEELAERIADTLPVEYLIANTLTGTSFAPVITYEDRTYISQALIDYVQKYLYEPNDLTAPTVAATGYELSATFQDIYDEAISAWPEYKDLVYDFTYCYTLNQGQSAAIIYSQYPVTYENNSDGSSKVRITGPFLRMIKNGVSNVISTYKPNNTGTVSGSSSSSVTNFGMAAWTGVAISGLVKKIGNLAPDLTDDEEYKTWLERQKFFIVQPGGDGDGNPDGGNDPKPQPYLPVRLLQQIIAMGDQSQEEARSGAQTTSPPEFTPIPGTVSPSTAPSPNPDPDPNPSPDPAPENPPVNDPDVGADDTGSTIPEWLQLIYKALVNIMLNIIVQIEQLQYLPEKIANAFEYLFGNIQIWIYEQIATIEAAAQWIGDKIDAITQELIALPTKIEIFFENLGARIETAFQWIWEHLAAAFETLGSIITTAFEWIWDHLATAFQNVIDTLNTFWQNLKNWMQTMADYLLNGLKTLFIPEKGYMDAKIAEMRGKFGIVDSALNTFDGVRSFFFSLGSKPPVIYIDLSAATGSYYFGGETIFVDMRWYSDYKPTMDLVLSAILWLWFVWRFMIALPGIIQGFSGYAPQNNGQTETGMVLASQWYER